MKIVMATEPKPHHVRADSGVGTRPVRQTLTEVQSFCEVLATLTSKPGYKALACLTEVIPQLEGELAEKDRKIKDLQSKVTNLEDSHRDYKQSLLGDFEQRFKLWERENDGLRENAENMKTAAFQKERDMAVLQKQCTDYEARIHDLEQKHGQATKKLKDKDQELGALDAKYQTSLKDSESLEQELKQANERANVMKKNLDEGMDKHQKLRDTTANLSAQLKELKSFSIELQPIDFKDVYVIYASKPAKNF